MEHNVELIHIIRLTDNDVLSAIQEAGISFKSAGKPIAHLVEGRMNFYPDTCWPTELIYFLRELAVDIHHRYYPYMTWPNEQSVVQDMIEFVNDYIQDRYVKRLIKDGKCQSVKLETVRNSLILNMYKASVSCDGDGVSSKNGFVSQECKDLLTPLLSKIYDKNYIERTFTKGDITISTFAPDDVSDYALRAAALVLSGSSVYMVDRKALIIDWFDEVHDFKIFPGDEHAAAKAFAQKVLKATDPDCTVEDIHYYITPLKIYPDLPWLY